MIAISLWLYSPVGPVVGIAFSMPRRWSILPESSARGSYHSTTTAGSSLWRKLCDPWAAVRQQSGDSTAIWSDFWHGFVNGIFRDTSLFHWKYGKLMINMINYVVDFGMPYKLTLNHIDGCSLPANNLNCFNPRRLFLGRPEAERDLGLTNWLLVY